MGFIFAAVFTCHVFLTFIIFLVWLCVVLHQRSYWFPGRSKWEKSQTIDKKEFSETSAPEEKKSTDTLSSKKKELPEKVSSDMYDVKVQTKKKKWLRGIILSLGMIIFTLGCMMFVLSSRGRYRDYRILILTGILTVLYYLVLFGWWFINWLINKIKNRRKEYREK